MGAYQKIIACYAEPDRRKARGMMHELVDSVNARPANAPGELKTLARTLKRRLPDVLAYFDLDHSGNGPTEAVNGRLEHLRGIALGFANLGNCITEASCMPEDSDKPCKTRSADHEPRSHTRKPEEPVIHRFAGARKSVRGYKGGDFRMSIMVLEVPDATGL